VTGTLATAAPGRNRACPCGSGRKFKACCACLPAAPAPAPAPGPPVLAVIDLEGVVLGLESGSLSSDLGPTSRFREVSVFDVIAALNLAWSKGIRAVHLVVDSGGGLLGAGYLLFDTLLRFREAGGRVVVYIAELAASSASDWILAADYIVAHPRARVWIHGSAPPPGVDRRTFAASSQFSAMNRASLAVYATGTLAEVADIRRWIATPGTAQEKSGGKLDARTAVALGFADEIGNRARSQDVALALARGEEVRSPRRDALHARGPRPEFAQALADLRGEMRARFGHAVQLCCRPPARLEPAASDGERP
jgi:ATP-dependent protease ClpP protease subunit